MMNDREPSRRLGRSNVFVGPLGMGGAALGNLYDVIEEARAIEAVISAYELGIRTFDTAPLYGYGLAEHRFGHALRSFPRDSYVLSTKVGRLLQPHGRAAPRRLTPSEGGVFVGELPFQPVFDYSFDGVLRSVEDSLQRLGTNRLDIALLHDVDRWTHGAAYEARLAEAIAGALPALQRMKDEGVIGAIGLGVNEIDACERLVDFPQIDCFMLAGRYTLLERTGSERLFALCAERDIAILGAGPFNSGILATGARPDAHYNYLLAPPEILERVAAIEGVCLRYGVTLAAAALQFPLQNPAVACVFAGCRSQRETEQSVMLLAQKIPAEFWPALSELESFAHRPAKSYV